MTQSQRLFLKPQLVSQEHALLGPLLNELNDDDRGVGWTYNAKISGFVDPRRLPPDANRTLVYTGSVSLVVQSKIAGSNDKSDQTRCLREVLLVLDLPDKFTKQKEELFSKLGVRYECISDSDDFDLSLDDCLNNQEMARKDQHPCVVASEQDTETIAYELLQEVCQRESLIFLPEVSAEDVFFPDFSKNDMAYSLASYLRKTTFDGVVATLPPYSRPLAIIEVDGTAHDGPDKKEKDKKKNEICRIASFPLFRFDARGGKDALEKSRGLLQKSMRAALYALASELDSFNTWEKYIQHELLKMSDPWMRDDLKVLIGKTMNDVQRLKTEVNRLKQPDPYAEIQERDFEDQMKSEEEWKEKQEKKSRLRKMQNIREELFFEPEGIPVHPLQVYADETDSARVDHTVEFLPCFKLRARYKGLGLKEEFNLQSIRLPLMMQLPNESKETVTSAIFAVVEKVWRDIFSSEFAHYYSEEKAKIEKKLIDKIRRLNRIQ